MLHGELTWGPAPKPPEFNALSKKMKYKNNNRSKRQSITPTSPPFLCPTPALGFALQHHPILLVGFSIILIENILKETVLFVRQILSCKSMLGYKISSLSSLNSCPTKRDHLRC